MPIKPGLDMASIERMVAGCFGTGCRVGEITPLTGGLFNAAYALRLPDRSMDVVLRIAPFAGTRLLTHETDLMRTEVAVYELLRQRTTIPLPEIYGHNFRRDIIPGDYMFISKLEGVPLRSIIDTLPADEAQPVLYELGQCMAQIHAVTGDYFGYFDRQSPPSRQTWKAAFLQMVADILTDGSACGVRLPLPYDEIYARFERVAGALDEVREPHLVHGDLWDANVFVIRREGRWTIEGIIDCDRALWGDPDMEYSLSFREGQDSFFEGYGRTLSDDPAARCRRQMYLAYLFLIVSVEVALRLQEADRSQWVAQQLEAALLELERFEGE